jgi:hypothetical protein
VTPNQGTTGASSRIPFNADNSLGNTKTLLYWTGKAGFVSARGGEWWYNGGTTGSWPGSNSMIRYSITEDRFRHWQGDTYTDSTNSVFQTWGGPHNFDGAAIDPSTGTIYRFLRNQNGTDAANWTLGQFNTATGVGSAIASTNGYTDGYRSTEFFPEMGVSGTVCLFRRQGAYAIATYNVASGAFSSIANAITLDDPATCYHAGKIYVASGGVAKAFYALTSAGVMETKSASPVQMCGTSDTVATQTILVSLGSYIYAFVNRTIYRYDPVANSWSGVYDTFPWSSNSEDAHFTVGPLSSLGVALVVRSINDFQHQALLWKP